MKITKAELAVAKKAERKMRKFIKSLGIAIAGKNNVLSLDTNRSVFNIKSPGTAVHQIRRALRLAKTPHKWCIIESDFAGIKCHRFRLTGLGDVLLDVNPQYPLLPKPLLVKPEGETIWTT